MARLPSSFDGSSSVFLGPFPKELTLVAAGSRVGRRCGNVVTGVGPTSRRLLLLAWGRRVHRGRSISGPPTAGMHRLVRTPVRGSRWERLVFVGEADKASDGGSPLVELLRSRGKSRSSCTCASASAGVGGGEICIDRDALRLLTGLEGALSRSRGRTPPAPASERARRPGSSCEWRTGLFQWRCPGAPTSRCCSSRMAWEERGAGAGWGTVEAAALPAGSTAPPPDPAACCSSSRIRTTPLAWLRLPECRGCSRATSSAPSVATRSPARAGADGPAPDEPIAVIPFFLGAMVMMKSVC